MVAEVLPTLRRCSSNLTAMRDTSHEDLLWHLDCNTLNVCEAKMFRKELI
jgi:hypothetical protein